MTETAVYAAGGVVWRIVEDKLRVLVIHRTRYRDLTLPTGKVDHGEMLAETAAREIFEETGIRVALGASRWGVLRPIFVQTFTQVGLGTAGGILLLVLLTMMLPEEVIAIPLSLVLGDLPLLGISLRGSVLAVILPVGIWGFSIFIMSEFMKEIPAEIEEAARLDGVGEFRMLFTIILPLCKPALGVIGIFGFMMVWDQYLLPLIAANDPSDYTLTVALSVLRNDTTVGPGVLLAGAVMAMIPSLLVYLFLQRSMIRGITAGATKG